MALPPLLDKVENFSIVLVPKIYIFGILKLLIIIYNLNNSAEEKLEMQDNYQ